MRSKKLTNKFIYLLHYFIECRKLDDVLYKEVKPVGVVRNKKSVQKLLRLLKDTVDGLINVVGIS